MNDMRDLVALDDVEEPRHVENVAGLEIDLVGDVADQPAVIVARIDDRPLPFAHEFPAGFRADDAHAAGNEDLHTFPSLASFRARFAGFSDH